MTRMLLTDLIPLPQYRLKRLNLNVLQVDVPLSLTQLRLILQQRHQLLLPLLIALLQLPHLPLKPLPELHLLLPDLKQLLLHPLVLPPDPLELLPRHRPPQLPLQLLHLPQLLLTLRVS